MKLLIAYLFCIFIAVAPVLGCLGPTDEATLQNQAKVELAPAVEAEQDAGAAAQEALQDLLAAQTPEELENAKNRLQAANAILAQAVEARKVAEASLAEKERELREANGMGFLGFATAFWPQLAAIAPVAAAGVGAAAGLFSPRWREHAGNAIKSIVPADGKMDVSGAITSLVKAYGFGHTSNDPGQLVEVVSDLIAKKGLMTPAEKADYLAKLDAARGVLTEIPVAA